jgi:hypothetical protein
MLTNTWVWIMWSLYYNLLFANWCFYPICRFICFLFLFLYFTMYGRWCKNYQFIFKFEVISRLCIKIVRLQYMYALMWLELQCLWFRFSQSINVRPNCLFPPRYSTLLSSKPGYLLIYLSFFWLGWSRLFFPFFFFWAHGASIAPAGTSFAGNASNWG